MKLKNCFANFNGNSFICYLTIIVFVICMAIGSIEGKFEFVLALAGLVIGVFASPFFTKDVEIEKYREQLAYN